MVEAVVEDAAVKEDIFRRADEALPAEAILASNTSSIPIASLAAVTGAPRPRDRHALLQPGAGDGARRGRSAAPSTSDETAAAIVALARELGKTPAEANDFPGFVSNRILMPFINEAVWALHDGRRRAGGDRHDREARLQPPDRAARARRPDRPRHVRGDHGGARSPGSATSATRRARCCASTSPPGGSAARAARASTTTPSAFSSHLAQIPRMGDSAVPLFVPNPGVQARRMRGGPVRLLLVDDDPGLRKLLRPTLDGVRRRGRGGRERRRGGRRDRSVELPDVVVLDVAHARHRRARALPRG